MTLQTKIDPSPDVIHVDVDDGWYYRTREGTLLGPYSDKETAIAAALLVDGKPKAWLAYSDISDHPAHPLQGVSQYAVY